MSSAETNAPRHPIPRQVGLALLVLLGGVTLLLGITARLSSIDEQETQSEFVGIAHDRAAAIHHELEDALYAVNSVQRLFDASTQVERDEFGAFVRPILVEKAMVHAFAWIPRGPDDHFEVAYTESRDGLGLSRSIDDVPDSIWPGAANRSRDEGAAVASAPFETVCPEGHSYTQWLIAPVYKDGTSTGSVRSRRSNLCGFVVAELRMSEVVERALLHVAPAGADVDVLDVPDGQEPEVTYMHNSRTRNGRPDGVATKHGEPPFSHTEQFAFAGRTWRVKCTPAPAYLAREAHWGPIAVWTIGLPLVLLSAAGVFGLQRWHATMMQQVTRRTSALHDSEERFRQLADTVREVFWLTNAEDGTVEYVSPAFETIWGRPRETLYKQPRLWIESIVAEDRARVDGAFALGPTIGRYDEIYRVVRLDGAIRWVHHRAFPIRNENGDVYRIAGIAADISDRKQIEATLLRANEEAEAASRAKGDFLATMSHELRTPLNGVVGMAELLLGTGLEPQQKRYASLVKSSADTLLSLINDILDFSKIESGKVELEEIAFDLRSAVESVATSFASRAEQKGLELISGVHPNVPTHLRGDPGRLQQILMNLVGNAIKFTDHGEVIARVTLEGETDDNATIHVTVSDTGIGIPADRTEHLFKSFAQADASTTRRFGGSGLGLAIAKQLVGLMGGEIGVMSEEGKGSTFWFTAQFCKQPTKSPNDKRASTSLAGKRVLVVDDNTTNRDILTEQFTNWRLEHDAVEDGAKALAALEAAAAAGRPFHLAILDMHMPGMDGLELARAIKADPRISGTVLTLLSSLQSSDPEQLRAAGFANWLPKPVRQSQLLDAIMEALLNDRKRELPAPEPPTDTEETTTDGQVRTRVLLAEDNEISQEVASTLLRRAGYECDIAANGRLALDAVKSRSYALVLMDCQMPEMDGFQATAAIRQAEAEGQVPGDRNSRIPIVALTANAVKGDRERCLEAGMDDYLTKPLEPEKLIQMIERHCPQRPDATPVDPPVAAEPGAEPPAPVSVPQTAPDTPGPFDVAGVTKRWGGDSAFVLKMIRKFCDQTPPELEQLEQSVAASDVETCTRIAHRLKGAASYVGADAFQRAAAELELMGRSGDLSDAQRPMDVLRSELERCLNWAGGEASASNAPLTTVGG